MVLEHFADAIMVPLGTLKTWLAAGGGEGARDDAHALPADDTDAHATGHHNAEIQTVLSSWETWRGTFGDFCNHLRQQQRVSFGPALISRILFVHGKRTPRWRSGRSPDERALRDAFETFFGGAQWVGDGSPIPISINGHRFVFNLELMVDAHSGGFVGMSIRDQEDSAAVTDALADGAATTGEAPLALHFNGMVYYPGEEGALQMVLVPWTQSIDYRMPVSVWSETVEHYYPNTAWVASASLTSAMSRRPRRAFRPRATSGSTRDRSASTPGRATRASLCNGKRSASTRPRMARRTQRLASSGAGSRWPVESSSTTGLT